MPKTTTPPAITGDQAREARKSLKASQAEVAEAIGINRAFYSEFEAGRYVLKDQQQRKLREFLGDAVPPGEASGDDDAAAAGESHQPKRGAARRARGTGGDDPSEPQDPQPVAVADLTPAEKASAALDELRDTASEPNGLRSKRTAVAVENAEAALKPLDYPELLELAEARDVLTERLMDLDAFQDLDTCDPDDREKVEREELRARGHLICHALYGSKWHGLDFNGLKNVRGQVARALPEHRVPNGQDESGWWILSSDHNDGHLFRAELAPFVVEAARNRAAPEIAAGKGRGT